MGGEGRYKAVVELDAGSRDLGFLEGLVMKRKGLGVWELLLAHVASYLRVGWRGKREAYYWRHLARGDKRRMACYCGEH